MKMKKISEKKNHPVEVIDDVLEQVSGGNSTTLPRTVMEVQLRQLIQQNPDLTVEELVALYAETYGMPIGTGNTENPNESTNTIMSIARSQ